MKNEYSFTTLFDRLDPNNPLFSLSLKKEKKGTLPFIATPQNGGLVPSGYAKWGQMGLSHSLMVQ